MRGVGGGGGGVVGGGGCLPPDLPEISDARSNRVKWK
jgi:hypothetical protein